MATSEQDFNQQIVEGFRANEGRVGGMSEGAPLLLLHHAGAKSGARRVSPLVYQTVVNGYAVFGSNDGADNHPAWYHNVIAHPCTTIEVGTATIEVSARVADDAERAPIWARQKELAPGLRGLRNQDVPANPGRPPGACAAHRVRPVPGESLHPGRTGRRHVRRLLISA